MFEVKICRVVLVAGIAVALGPSQAALTQHDMHNHHIVSHSGPFFPPQQGKVAGINYVMVQNNFNNGDKIVSIDRTINVQGKITKAGLSELLTFLHKEAVTDVPHTNKKWSYKLTAYGDVKAKLAKDRLVGQLTDANGKVTTRLDDARISATSNPPRPPRKERGKGKKE